MRLEPSGDVFERGLLMGPQTERLMPIRQRLRFVVDQIGPVERPAREIASGRIWMAFWRGPGAAPCSTCLLVLIRTPEPYGRAFRLPPCSFPGRVLGSLNRMFSLWGWFCSEKVYPQTRRAYYLFSYYYLFFNYLSGDLFMRRIWAGSDLFMRRTGVLEVTCLCVENCPGSQRSVDKITIGNPKSALPQAVRRPF